MHASQGGHMACLATLAAHEGGGCKWMHAADCCREVRPCVVRPLVSHAGLYQWGSVPLQL